MNPQNSKTKFLFISKICFRVADSFARFWKLNMVRGYNIYGGHISRNSPSILEQFFVYCSLTPTSRPRINELSVQHHRNIICGMWVSCVCYTNSSLIVMLKIVIDWMVLQSLYRFLKLLVLSSNFCWQFLRL